MAGVFYSRYVPTAKPTSPPFPFDNQQPDRKRKRKLYQKETDGTQSETLQKSLYEPPRTKQEKKGQRRLDEKHGEAPVKATISERSKKSYETNSPNASDNIPSLAVQAEIESISQKQRKQRKRKEKDTQEAAAPNVQASESAQHGPVLEANEGASMGILNDDLAHEPSPNISAPSRRSRNKTKKRQDPERVPEALDTTFPGHERVSSRYDRSKKAQAVIKDRAEMEIAPTEDSHHQTTEIHGLEPLPQPSILNDTVPHPSFSSLPNWIANAQQVTDDQTCPFEALEISPDLLSNLKKHSLSDALPVQKALIPLLLEGKHRYVGDLCVSAPTGSGKTLAYALPLVGSLVNRVTTRLRGLIVVPTRELATQVFKVCEMCASGSRIQLAIATGRKAMKEEQAFLIEKEMKLDPATYHTMYTKPLTPSDWDAFGLENAVEDLNESEDDMPGYVPEYRSKVDLLICTPGRLVDHIRFTKGFTLDYLEWFIVDEADKLLDDSFQEWVDVILPAVEARCSSSLTDELLTELGMSRLPKSVRKVILSATMTNDVSKLNSLRLHNPKLVVVADAPADSDATNSDLESKAPNNQSGAFNMPKSLCESAVAVGDGMEKPLFLLQILKRCIERFPDGLGTSNTNSSDLSNEGTEKTMSSDSESNDDQASSTSDTTDISSSSSKSFIPVHRSSRPPKTRSRLSSALVFTRSSEAALRLRRLLVLLEPRYDEVMATIVRSSNSTSSRNAISLFRQGKISILIATDRASRGLDLPGLETVISYDIPSSVKAYIHRVGRTARAGKIGRAWTLVTHREGRWFWKEIGKTDQIKRQSKVKKENMQVSLDDSIEERYEIALGQLKEDV